MSSSKNKGQPKPKQNVIKLTFPENLLKSLNIMYEKQNQELMKVISEEKIISLSDLLKFTYDQKTVTILPEE